MNEEETHDKDEKQHSFRGNREHSGELVGQGTRAKKGREGDDK